MWSVVDDSESQQWDYLPQPGVGPLRFGMSLQDALAVLQQQGFTGSSSAQQPNHGALTHRAEFRPAASPPYLTAVTLYFRELQGLACVAVDALCGPQVTLDGTRLVGRVPSELLEEFFDYVSRQAMTRQISVEGDAASDELGIMIRAQRAGDILLTRPFFAHPEGWAYTVHDCVPTSEWDVH